MRIRLIWEGKTKNPHLRALQADYQSRIGHFTDLVVEEIKGDRKSSRRSPPDPPSAVNARELTDLSAPERRLLERLNGSYKIFLDGRGREWTSAEFARWLGRQALNATPELVFLVGGTEGFSGAFRARADLLFALSRMTLTRDWARVLLLEQIYRGFAILRGYPYSR